MAEHEHAVQHLAQRLAKLSAGLQRSCQETIRYLIYESSKKVQSKKVAEYGIYRIEKIDADGYPNRLWLFAVTRQGRGIKRNFHDGIYGGEASALLMAQSYRDAVLRLFPPLTQFQLSSKPRSTNTSGTPGVHAIRRGGRLVRWRAMLEVQGRIWRKSFSIRDYGEEQAKALAIAERMRMLENEANGFATVHPHATGQANEQFADLLNGAPEHTAALFDPAYMQKHLQALDAWFDALKPLHVHVRVNTYVNNKQQLMLAVTTSDGWGPGKLKIRAWSLVNVSYGECLPQVWSHIEERLTELLGEACWRNFKRRHRSTFFASNPAEGFYTRYRYDSPDRHSLRSRPPPELLPMLQGFVVPKLPAGKEKGTQST